MPERANVGARHPQNTDQPGSEGLPREIDLFVIDVSIRKETIEKAAVKACDDAFADPGLPLNNLPQHLRPPANKRQ